MRAIEINMLNVEDDSILAPNFEKAISKKAAIYLGEGVAFILTEHLNAETHRHNALQITISINDGSKLRCNSLEEIIESEVILIPPLIDHAFYENSGLVLIILVDDESIVADSIGASKVQPLEIFDFAELQTHIREAAEFSNLNHVFEKTKFFSKFMKSKIDERMHKLISELKKDDEFLPSAKDAADICHLSESRFLHLFKKELGLPFRKYILWIKLRRTLKYLKMGRSLTEAAHVGGFSDSAHLSRYFKESFGLSPSEVFQNSQFIQAD